MDVPGASGYPRDLNRYNRVAFGPVGTTALRVLLEGGANPVGLLEVRTFGG